MSRVSLVAGVVALLVATGAVASDAVGAFTSCGPQPTSTCLPVAIADTYSTGFAQPLVAPAPGVLGNDAGPTGTVVDPGASDSRSAWNASVVLHADGSFTYTPDPSTPFSGIDSFQYVLRDTNGDTVTGAVNVDVVAQANNDHYSAVAGARLRVTGAGVLANDHGVDPASVVLPSASAHGGQLQSSGNGAFDYQPPTGFTGTDSFSYHVADLNGDFSYSANVVISVTPAPPPPVKPKGYWMVSTNGHVYPFGQVKNYGNAPDATHMEPTPSKLGYWIVDSAGTVFAFGDAHDYGSGGGLHFGEHVSSISATPTGKGYWLFTNFGRVFARGDARNYGDMSGVTLAGPVVGSIATPTGRGYYMVGSDGGIFSFGDAHFYGSMGGIKLAGAVNGISPTPDNRGYWLVASDGGIFAFGDARFRGSMGGKPLNRPIIGMVPYGNGYLMVAGDGGIFAFSDLAFYGSLGGVVLPAPVAGVAAGG